MVAAPVRQRVVMLSDGRSVINSYDNDLEVEAQPCR